MKRHKGDVMIEHRGSSKFYYILTSNPSDTGLADVIYIHINSDGKLFSVQMGGMINVNGSAYDVARVWLKPEIGQEFPDLPEMRRELRESADCPAAPVGMEE